MRKIIALVQSRSGSVRVKHKNLKQILGMPLIGLAVRQALLVPKISEVYVSTDSMIYAEIARNYGAVAPFIRPAEISGSEATDYDVFIHFLMWYKLHVGELPELIVQVRPTAPVRDSETIQQAIEFMLSHPEFDSLRSVSAPHQSPYKMWSMNENCELSSVIKVNGIESYDMPTQSLPKTYGQDGIVDIVRPETLINFKSMAGAKIAGFSEHPKTWDIDTDEDLKKASQMIRYTEQCRLLKNGKAIGGNLGIIQGRLTQAEVLQKFPDDEWKEEFDRARETGYTSIEWIRDKDYNKYNPIWRDDFNWTEIENVSLLSGVSVRSICDDYVQLCDWENLSVKQFERLSELIIRGSMLGVKTIVYPLFEKAELTSERKYYAFKQHIKSLAGIAYQLGIYIALEISNNADQLCEIFNDINLENIGLCVDTGNLYAAGVSIGDILECKNLKNRIIHVHIKDRDAAGNNVVLGDGKVDFNAVIDALVNMKYAGTLVTETNRGNNPIETAISNGKYIADIIDNVCSGEIENG